jgi:hypothetical protein
MENVVTDIVPSSEYEGYMEFKLNGEEKMLPTWEFLQSHAKPIQMNDIKLGYTYYYAANGMVPKIFKCYYIISYSGGLFKKKHVIYNNQEICTTENKKTGIMINNNCINNYKISPSFITDDNQVIDLNNKNSKIYHIKADREIGLEIYLPIINNSQNRDKKLLINMIENEQNEPLMIDYESNDENSSSGGRKKRRTKKYRKIYTKNKKFRKLKSHRKTKRKARNNNKYNK